MKPDARPVPLQPTSAAHRSDLVQWSTSHGLRLNVRVVGPLKYGTAFLSNPVVIGDTSSESSARHSSETGSSFRAHAQRDIGEPVHR
jgi:hypothetical protein